MPSAKKMLNPKRSSGEIRVDNDTGRIEAFSDGVFAVAITLLALDIHVPP